MKKGPKVATKNKIARAMVLLQEAMKDEGNDWEASCALGRALEGIRNAQRWEIAAEQRRRDLAEQHKVTAAPEIIS